MPASQKISRHGATVVLRLAVISGHGRARAARDVGADHVFKRDRQPQPSYERIDDLSDQQLPAWRVGAPLELKGDTHRPWLVHAGQHSKLSRRAASRRHRCLCLQPTE